MPSLTALGLNPDTINTVKELAAKAGALQEYAYYSAARSLGCSHAEAERIMIRLTVEGEHA